LVSPFVPQLKAWERVAFIVATQTGQQIADTAAVSLVMGMASIRCQEDC
jgi:hypothetical protein